tara:strand:+ start:144 stop:686 length:543 start_codon:yes stop_codon:yes gene_type:complete
MAIKTMTAGTGGGNKFSEGWHTVKISKAQYGDQNGQKILDLWFEDYPDNFNTRIWERVNKTTNEEFAIANTFKYAVAGIKGVLTDNTGKYPIMQYDDESENLVGKTINIFVYKENKTGNNYSRVWNNIAPVPQETEHITFTPEQVEGIKAGIASRCKQVTSAPSNGSNQPSEVVTDEMPF